VVTNVTSLTRSGLSDFVVQRVSAAVLALYTLCLLGWFATTAELSHAVLAEFFGRSSMKIFSTLAVLSTAAHAWIGMWTVGTDYIRPHYFGAHATSWRLLYQGGVLIVLFLYVAWGLQVFWTL